MSFISQITDPEELRILEQDRRRWQWQRIMVEWETSTLLEHWIKEKYNQIIDEYKQYESETPPNVYYLGFPSWCWSNHQDICETFMTEQGIE